MVKKQDYSARWYSPNYGRFITEDTFFGWIALSLNKYSYVHNNPIKYIDPTGNAAEDDNDKIKFLRYVSLYVDGDYKREVKLYNDGKTYFPI